ncbi:MAG: hypothetical protein WBX11_17630 [Thiobacillaceae bacterium]
MKRQIGFKVMMGAAWLAGAGAIGSVLAADSPMNDQAATAPAQLDWTALSSNAQMPNVGRLDWNGLSSQTEVARADAANPYIGTSLTEPQAQGRLDWTGLSK